MHAAPRIASQLLLGLALATVGAGCHRESPDISSVQPRAATVAPSQGMSPAPTAPMPPGHPAIPSGAATTAPPAPEQAAQGDDGVSGTVVETMNSGGYTYAKLDRGTTQVWVAGPETKGIAVGTIVGKVNGMVMAGFHSSTLDRTFDQIYFINSFPLTGAAMANPHAGGMPAAMPAAPIEKVAPLAGGKTVAEIFAGKATLAGKPVVVHGKITKVNNGILGHNWLHLQDGTGGTGTNDLIITTDAVVNKGDVVVVRGTVATDKDFGAGYSYPVLVENAAIAAK